MLIKCKTKKGYFFEYCVQNSLGGTIGYITELSGIVQWATVHL